MAKSDTGELLPLVDETGMTVGKATRGECHDGKSKLLHPVVHLHVVDADTGAILLQKRSMSKRIQPGKWDTAVGGHVDYGESVETALARESREELGIDVAGCRKVCSYIFESEVEKEYINVYVLFRRFDLCDLNFAKDEIDSVRYWTSEELKLRIEQLTPNFVKEYESVLLPFLKEYSCE